MPTARCRLLLPAVAPTSPHASPAARRNDYTPVCTTELGEAQLQSAEFERRGVKLIGLSCNTAADHDGWVKDIEALRGPGSAPQFPIIADPKRDVAALLGMLDEDEKDAPGIPATVRKVRAVMADGWGACASSWPRAPGAHLLGCGTLIFLSSDQREHS